MSAVVADETLRILQHRCGFGEILERNGNYCTGKLIRENTIPTDSGWCQRLLFCGNEMVEKAFSVYA